jgi:hypothetical protein
MNESTPLNREAPTATNATGRASWSTFATPQRLRVVTVLALVVAMAVYIANAAPASTWKLKPASTSTPETETETPSPLQARDSGPSLEMLQAAEVDAGSRKDRVDFIPGFGSPLEKQVRRLPPPPWRSEKAAAEPRGR